MNKALLTEEELSEILSKEKLNISDIILLNEYLDYIGDVFDKYSMEEYLDVAMNLNSDVERIISRLRKELERYKKKESKC